LVLEYRNNPEKNYKPVNKKVD